MKWSEIITKCDKTINRGDKIVKSDVQWREELDDLTYMVTRQKGTEKPFSNDMCESFEKGVYSCRCCGEKLFDSTSKFDSGTGWPSFDKPVHVNSINYFKDTSHNMIRVEVTCSRCDAHLGHVFPDGPQSTGVRFCINSVSLTKSE